jgi:hypothetical protein
VSSVGGKLSHRHPVAVVGAGPYGLAATAHFGEAGVETRTYGKAMQFWREQMPAGMLLRSRPRSSHIADPKQVLKLDDFARARGRDISAPVSLTDFLEYGRWFQRHAAPDIDTRKVQRIESDPSGSFRLILDDGEPTLASRVVIAAGLAPFAWRPAPFDALPRAVSSHASEHQNFKRFRDQRVLVIGGGQSALESAALLHESGADVEVLARAASIRWLRETVEHRGMCIPLLHRPPTDVGGRLMGWIVAIPDLYRRMPRRFQQFFPRTYAPAGASWIRARLADVPITTGGSVKAVVAGGGGVCVSLQDGTERRADHILLGTGYRVDIARYEFLAPELLRRIRIVNGYPSLGPGLESSAPGLHFLGAPAAMSFGPIMRFVVGTWYAAPTLVRRIVGKPQPLMSLSFAH